jgi:hypothetical protein
LKGRRVTASHAPPPSFFASNSRDSDRTRHSVAINALTSSIRRNHIKIRDENEIDGEDKGAFDQLVE